MTARMGVPGSISQCVHICACARAFVRVHAVGSSALLFLAWEHARAGACRGVAQAQSTAVQETRSVGRERKAEAIIAMFEEDERGACERVRGGARACACASVHERATASQDH
jgi:hypothetical protein